MNKLWRRILALILVLALVISLVSFDFKNAQFKTKKNQLAEHYTLARAQLEAADYDAAMDEFTRCLKYLGRKSDPDIRTDIYFQRGRILLLVREENETAISELNQAIVGSPELSDAYALRAQAELNLQRYEEAAEDLEMYISLSGDMAGYAVIASIREAQGDYERAVEAYELSGMEGASADFHRGVYLSGAGQTEAAAQAFERCAGDGEYGASGLYNAGILRLNLEQGEKAVSDLTGAKNAGANYADMDAALAEAYLLKARANLDAERYAEAASDLEAYIRISGNAEGYESLVSVYQAIGETEKALDALERSCASDAAADYLRGELLEASGQSAAAARAYERCKGDNEYAADAMYRAGMIRMALRHYSMAVDDLLAAIEAGANQEGVDSALSEAYLLKAQSVLDMEEYASAAADLEEYIRISGDTSAYQSLASIYQVMGENTKALDALERSGADDAASNYQRGVLLEALGQTEAAARAYERCAGDGEYGAAALYNAGILYRALGDYDRAVEVLNAAEEAGANYEEMDGVLSEAYVMKAQQGLEQEQYAAAAKALEEYIRISGDTQAYLSLASIYQIMGNNEAALEALGLSGVEDVSVEFQRGDLLAAAGQTEEAALAYECCAGNADYRAAALYNAGVLRLMQGQYEAAINDLLCSEEAGADYEGIESLLAEAYVLKAQEELQTEQYEAAAADLEAYFRFSGDPQGLEGLSAVYQVLGENEKALEALEQSGADDVNTRYQRGVLLDSVGRTEEAALAFESCAGDGEYAPTALYNAGVLRMVLEQYDIAAVNLTAALEAGADYDGIYFKRGICAMLQNAYEAAAEDFRSSLSLESNKKEARCNLAACLMQQEDFLQAAAELDILMTEEGYPQQAAYFRAVCRWQMEDYTGAMEDFTLCVENGVMTVECCYNRGLLRLAADNYVGAEEDFTVCIENDYETALSYYQRAQAYQAQGKYTAAEADYQRYLEFIGEAG